MPYLDIKSEFYRTAVAWLNTKVPGETVTEITYWEDDSWNAGGCETCAYTEYVVEISYKVEGQTSPYGSKMYTYVGRFSSLLEELFSFAENHNSGT